MADNKIQIVVFENTTFPREVDAAYDEIAGLKYEILGKTYSVECHEKWSAFGDA